VLSPILAGFSLGLSLIIAIGAQNLFVLRQGIRREHVVLVATICAISDALLIALGVSGVGLVLQAVPWLIDVVRWAGALFLVAYGVLAARRAWRPSGRTLEVEGADAASVLPEAPSGAYADRPTPTGIRVTSRALPVALTCLALTWLNPHVYLDTVFLLGSVANTHGDARWLFAAGAMAASVVWFFGLALGARYLGRWLGTPRAWRILDAVIAVVMIALGVSLVLPH
jgi:L-lysine exporter family protein LysE/ArgO